MFRHVFVCANPNDLPSVAYSDAVAIVGSRLYTVVGGQWADTGAMGSDPWPVGAVFRTTSEKDVGDLLGGKWELFYKEEVEGRVIYSWERKE